MEKSQLVDVLRTFSSKEIRDCRKWLHSPAHNQRDDVVDLFEYLFAYDHLDNEKFLDKERVFRKIFPGEPYDDARLRQTMYFLMKAVEEFLIYQEYAGNEIKTQMALAGVFRKRGLDKVFQKTMRNIEKVQKKSSVRDSQYMFNEYLLEQEKYRYLSYQKRSTQLNLQEISDAIDVFYLSDKLRQSCIMLSHQAVYKTQYATGMLGSVLQYLQENQELLDIPAIGIYYYIYQASTNKDEPTYFFRLKEQIEKFGHLFPKSDVRDIYLLAINYCIAKINMGEKDYLREMFELNRRGIEKEVFMENNVLDRYTFRNIVTAGLTLKEFDWVEHFIEKYRKYLEPKHRENFVHFALSSLHFEKGDYDKARELLIHFEYTDLLINLQAKSMLIRMYYEDGEFEALESLLESMRNYVHRKKDIGYHKQIYSNLIRFTKKLVRINPYNKAQKEKLRREINQAKQLREKRWFLEQLDMM